LGISYTPLLSFWLRVPLLWSGWEVPDCLEGLHWPGLPSSVNGAELPSE
jgi:hypothetical protein